MKQKLLSRLILAGLAGVAAAGAHAGQIQASSVSIAREAISSDTQAIIAPSISYRFAGDVDARVQAQTFQVQFTLEQGAWASAPNVRAFSITDGVSGVVQNQVVTGTSSNTTANYSVNATSLSTDKKTLWVTFTVAADAALGLVKQPIISLNVTSNAVDSATSAVAVTNAARATVNGLKTVVGDIAADFAADGTCAAVKTARVGVKHYVGLQNPTAIASDANGTPDEHVRSAATNSGTLITFPTNLGIKFAAATGDLKLTTGGNTKFTSLSGSKTTSTLVNFVPGTANVVAGQQNNPVTINDVARLGITWLTQNATGLDSNVTDTYALADVNTAIIPGDAVENAGAVEIKSYSLQVTATNGFSEGGRLFLAPIGADCDYAQKIAETAAISAANAAGPITLALSAPGTLPANRAAEVCYKVTGTNLIPSSAFTVVGTLVKAPEAAGNSFAEQNNVCNGTLFSLGGGLKIDVRNYASSAEQSGYMSVLRFINNSDSTPADVYAQIIHQDGKLGNWAKLTDLAPRASLNMTAAQIDAMLAAGTAPNAGAANNGPAAAAHLGGNATRSDTAPRLRITSNSGRSLRVQNYLFNSATGQILEGSGSQAVDFEGSTDRAPLNEGQYQSQDANSGINLK